MIKFFKSVLVLVTVMFLCSCLSKQESSVYAETYSVVKSLGTITYFASDDNLNLFPRNNTWKTEWGKAGDRVFMSFYCNPYAISEDGSLYVDVDQLIVIDTHNTALPESTDTGSGSILNYDDANSGIYKPYVWIAQDFLTVLFNIKYSDDKKHTFGFIEEPDLYSHRDTVCIRMWHNALESETGKTMRHAMSLNLSRYVTGYESAVISIRFDASDSNNNISEQTIYAKYSRRTSGY